jgi:two-component system, chemotaxis family, protein-glutamate methylesterase/glutaminase
MSISARRLVVIGTSAGGLDALRVLIGGLPSDFPTAICIVMHTSPQSPGILGAILERAGTLTVANATDGERLRAGRVYVAPPDFHLTVEPGRVRVARGPRENRFRPAIDPLFRSAAQVFGPGAIGVIMTGNLDDGVAGLWAIKQLGGTAVIQDPEDAQFSALPRHAVRHVAADYVLPLPRIAEQLVSLVSAVPVVAEAPSVPERLEVEVEIAKDNHARTAQWLKLAEPSAFACPECHGVLMQVPEGDRTRFRCHTGHAYSPETLLSAIAEGTETAMWNAIRALEEGALLIDRMARHLEQSHPGEDAGQFTQRSGEARRQADVLRSLVSQPEPLPSER